MNKHLHPAYEKYVRKPKKGAALPRPAVNMLQLEFEEALKEDERDSDERQQHSKWVPVKVKKREREREKCD